MYSEFSPLLFPLLERMLIVWFAAYVFSQTALFWNILKERVTLRDYLYFVMFFSGLSIIGTHLGIPLEDGAIANFRPLGAIVAGLIGGPWMGVLVGAISGFHRFQLGGITAIACGIATIAEGLTGGIVRIKAKNNFLDLRYAFVAGIVAEIIQFAIVLIITKPYEKALAIEQVVVLPMIVVNTIGVVGFILIIRDVYKRYNGLILTQFNRFIDIERNLSQAIRYHMTPEKANDLVGELMSNTDLKGLFISRSGELLSARGSEYEIKQVMTYLKAQEPCTAPLRVDLVGTNNPIQYYCVPVITADYDLSETVLLGVKLLGKTDYDSYVMKFTDGLGELMRNQMTIERIRVMESQLETAQLGTLKAQIQPHFLYNSLSTISSFCRTDGMKARELILDLANYFRATVNIDSDFALLEDEINLVKSYLHIEEARLGERLKVEFDIEGNSRSVEVPTYSIQPLVENAIKHGISNSPAGGCVWIQSKVIGEFLHVEVRNTHEPSCLSERGCGQALNNIGNRLKLLYGNRAALFLNCEENVYVSKLTVPIRRT